MKSKDALQLFLVLNFAVACNSATPVPEKSLATQTVVPVVPTEIAPYSEIIPKEIEGETGITVYTDGGFLSGERFQSWVDEKSKSGEFVSDPKIRTTAFVIGNLAWEKWNKEGVIPATGEKILPFIKRHTDKMNKYVTNQTRQESGVSDIQIQPIVIVVDETQILKNIPESIENPLPPINNSVFGSWIWDSNYTPEDWHMYDNKTGEMFDFSLMHELGHESLYISVHLYNYFIKTNNTGGNGANWVDLLRRGNNFQIGNPKEIIMWQGGTDKPLEGMETKLYQVAGYQAFVNNEFMLSHPEELYMKRMLDFPPFVESLYPEKFNFHDHLMANDLALSYAINLDGREINSATLHRSKIIKHHLQDNVEWGFGGGDTVNVKCEVRDGKVIVPHGVITELNNDGTPVSYILNIDGQMLAFTDYHLLYWHWKEQVKNGEQLKDGATKFSVQVPITEWVDNTP